MSIFIIIAPSFSTMFLFERKLFLELDLFKLMLLCITINLIIFFVYFIAILHKVANKKLSTIFEIKVEMESSFHELDKNKEESYKLKQKLGSLKQDLCLKNKTEDEIKRESNEINIKLNRLNNIIEEQEKKINKCDDKLNDSTVKKIISHTVLETSLNMLMMTNIVWISQCYYILSKTNITLEKKISLYIIAIGMPVILNMIISFRYYIKMKKLKRENHNI